MAEASPARPRTGRPRLRARPIITYLVVLMLVALLPALIFSAVLLARNSDSQRKVVETLVTGNARTILQSVDREIIANITTLRVLSTSPELPAGHYEDFYRRVAEALQGSGAYVYLIDKELNSFLSTRLPIDKQQKVQVSDMVSAHKALSSGEVVVSDAVKGRVSQQWVVNILLPIKVAGEPIVVGFNRGATEFNRVLAINRMPEGWNVALVDSKGIIISQADNPEKTGTPFPTPIQPGAMGSGWQETRIGGQPVTEVTEYSPLTGWSLIAWAPSELVNRPLNEVVWSLIAGGVVLGLAVVMVVYWLSLSIGRSVWRLETDAKRLGAGQPVESRPYPIVELETVARALADASSRRQAAETEVRFLMRELAHRSKNQMTVIASMAKQTARRTDSVTDFVASFERRILGLARSTDLLLANGVAGIDLGELLASQLDPFYPVDGERVMVNGPALRINGQAAQILGMAAHELATNAVKYGGLAHEEGKLDVRFAVEEQWLVLDWRESGFVPQIDGNRRGFGTAVLETMVARSLSGEVNREILPDGLKWTIRLPMTALDPVEGFKSNPAAE